MYSTVLLSIGTMLYSMLMLILYGALQYGLFYFIHVTYLFVFITHECVMNSNLKYIALGNIIYESLAQNKIAPKTISNSQPLLRTELNTSFIYSLSYRPPSQAYIL